MRYLLWLILFWGLRPLPAQLIEFIPFDNLRIPDGSFNMIPTSEGNFVSVGYWEDDGWLTKLNPCGALIWTQTYRRGQLPTRLYDVAERPGGGLWAVGTIDTLQPLPQLGRVPVGWVIATNACGDIEREQILRLPAAGLPNVLEAWCPTTGYALDPTWDGGLVLTGQTLFWEVTNLVPLQGIVRKTAFLYRLDSLLSPVAYTALPQLPQADSLVAYSVKTLPSREFLISGTYHNTTTDSLYLFALKTDSLLQPLWQQTWFGAPPQLGIPGQPVNYAVYHTLSSIEASPQGTVYLGGTRFAPGLDLLDACLLAIDPADGSLLNAHRFANPGIDLGLRVSLFDQGVLLGGSQTLLDGTTLALGTAVLETDWQLQPQARYTYTDSSEYQFLGTSVVAGSASSGQIHALAGVRYLAPQGQAIDTSNSILFFNSAATEDLPLQAQYYGGVIVQIEDVNVRDTVNCRPAQPPTNCLPTVTGTREALTPQPLRVFPQPATDLVELHWPQPLTRPGRWHLYDAQGRCLRQGLTPVGMQQLRLPVAGLPPGLYHWQHVAGGPATWQRIWVW